jgi:hypothetical protein
MSSSSVEQPDTTRTGRWRPLAALWRQRTRTLGVLLALLAVATVVVWVTRDRQPVEITEMGFSAGQDVSGTPEGASRVSWGAIVENTSDRAANGVDLRATYHDADGTTEDRLYTVDLLPGQRLGVGEDLVALDLNGPIVDVEFTVDRVESWRPRDADAAIAADDVWVGYSPDGELTVAFVARSPNDSAVESISARAVFRNADGEIVGGSSGITGLQPGQPAQAWMVMPVEIPDASTVEVYILP